MPDKYEFRRFADNLTHPWFNDIKSEFKRLWISPYRLLLCILCFLLMNIAIDEATFLHHRNYYHNTSSHHASQQLLNNTSSNDSNGVVLHHSNLQSPLVIMNNVDTSCNSKQCDQIPIFSYFGSKQRNVFHTQLMIGVLFGVVMNARLPVLLSFINIMIRSGCTFKPKIIPMFIDRKQLTPTTFYGSSYKLLRKRISIEPHNDDEEEGDEQRLATEPIVLCDDEEEEKQRLIDYDFARYGLPKQLYGDLTAN